ncbi:MAG: hypothetical protein WA414_19320 [Acidobacteriaceae bacterium]
MLFSMAHITLKVGYFWIVLNLAAIAFFTVLFYAEQKYEACRRRRILKSASLAPVVVISTR